MRLKAKILLARSGAILIPAKEVRDNLCVVFEVCIVWI